MIIENIFNILNSWTVSVCQLMALIVILVGIIKALIIYFQHILSLSPTTTAFQKSRLQLGYSFSLGLSFLIGASILRTTLTPNWNDIGQLTAIIAVRTLLNYLLLQAITGASVTEEIINSNAQISTSNSE
ncbi:MAG TPA: hypothetical protein DCF68_02955 [Cyanothece sp. UBA12306]|nr:hypothetical protein [Cyanothece sp. UBA12306]